MADEVKEVAQSPVPDFDKITDLQVHNSKPAAPAEPPAKTEPVISKDADGEEEPEADPIDKLPAAKAEDSDKKDKDEAPEDDEIEISEEDFNELVSQRFDGKHKSLDEIEEKLSRLEELEKNPAPKFQSERHKKLFEYIDKFAGDDFGKGVENFARLQSIEDVSKLSAKDALKELFIQENTDLSREEAVLLFEDDFEKKYPEGIEDEKAQKISSIRLDKEGGAARKKLGEMQSQISVKKDDTQSKEIEKSMAEYKANVEKAILDFDRITITPDEKDPDSAFNYDFENSKVVAQAMTDWDFNCKTLGWVDDKGNIDFEKMKLDYAFMHNRDAIISNAIHHGEELGKEKLLREMENRDPKKKESKASGKVIKTREEAQDEAIMNLR